MSRIKLGAGTYAFRDVDVFQTLPRLRRIGFEAIEILAGEGWPTAPARLNRDDRSRLSNAIQEQGFESPALMALLPLCEEGDGAQDVDAEFRAVCQLARDLSFSDDPSVLSSPIGHDGPPWDSGRVRIADRLLALADIAQDHGVILAVEPHVGNPLDSPEKAVWLMQQTNHPALRLNFDMSHFHVQKMDLRHCIEACLPYAVHIHVKDGFIDADGEVVFQLPGEGSLDLGAYFRILAEHDSTIPVTAEVSAMIWRRPDYDPWAAAEQSFAALDAARRAAGS
ncbi:MAG: sugar phosphate isomerase/epimerase [Chloroflexota bacterium]|nr:sugar phosphate isomerase/epimerase [Chloroflexota bacterium]MDE2897412.1 sugar phosphate isomerase/epimerase [Chloroflexota bacterium]